MMGINRFLIVETSVSGGCKHIFLDEYGFILVELHCCFSWIRIRWNRI